MSTIGELGELAVIARIARAVGRGRNVARGIGDDCAIVRAAGARHDWALTTDAVIEGVHFLPSARPRAVGHKAAGRVLSDLAATGAEPLYLLTNLVAPPETPLARIEGLYRGAAKLCGKFGAAIIGGDTAKGKTLELHVFGVGRVPRGRALLRSGARPGDAIYVTGELGGSLRGRHLSFEPRVREGQFLLRWASAMLDVSDGLATDLAHLCDESRVGARLASAAIPLSRHARGVGSALRDGEDFELLFTVPARRAAAFERAWRRAFSLRCSRIGEVTKPRGMWLDGRPLARSGFEHFRSRDS